MLRAKVKEHEGCWLWQGCTRKSNGYGLIKFHNRLEVTHRIAWEAWNGDIPADKLVLHKCSQPNCINPAHLYLGGQKELAKTSNKHKVVGEDVGSSKLTEEKVRKIRTLYKEPWNMTQGEIAEKFDVSICTIWHIVSRRSWKHVRQNG